MNDAMKMEEEWRELQRKQEFDGGRRTGLLLLMCAGEPAVGVEVQALLGNRDRDIADCAVRTRRHFS